MLGRACKKPELPQMGGSLHPCGVQVYLSPVAPKGREATAEGREAAPE